MERLQEIIRYKSNTNKSFCKLLSEWFVNPENSNIIKDGIELLKKYDICVEIMKKCIDKINIFSLNYDNMISCIEYYDVSKLKQIVDRSYNHYCVILKLKCYNLVTNDDLSNINFINCIKQYKLHNSIIQGKINTIIDPNILDCYNSINLIDPSQGLIHFSKMIEEARKFLVNPDPLRSDCNLDMIEQYFYSTLWYIKNYNIQIEIPSDLIDIGRKHNELCWIDFLGYELKIISLKYTV